MTVIIHHSGVSMTVINVHSWVSMAVINVYSWVSMAVNVNSGVSMIVFTVGFQWQILISTVRFQ